MALSNVRPMRNSSDKSTPAISHCVLPPGGTHTVDSLLIGESLTLLSPVPLDDQPVSKSKRGSRVRGPVESPQSAGTAWIKGTNHIQLIAIIKRASEGGFNMAHEIFLREALNPKY
jgi:hypothetical protein